MNRMTYHQTPPFEYCKSTPHPLRVIEAKVYLLIIFIIFFFNQLTDTYFSSLTSFHLVCFLASHTVHSRFGRDLEDLANQIKKKKKRKRKRELVIILNTHSN